eukprot:GHVS01005712.1.p1 GENE.GHVS01005712.1~~GHVS01005712.1.p1  ORF type:complete len:367 (+),score=66.40 GHVS01005712.1:216-1316(+)
MSSSTSSSSTVAISTDLTSSPSPPTAGVASSPPVASSALQLYCARVLAFQRRMNPVLLTLSDGQIRNAKTIVRNPNHPDYAWACNVVEGTVHPQTGDIIPLLGRLSAFVPVNIPVCGGMLLAPPTLGNVIGWQWLNQTYNAYFNFSQANKDITKPQETGIDMDLLKGYSAATVVSVGLAVSSTQWLSRSRQLSDVLRARLHMIVPYFAVASAGVANVGLMRIRELTDGIPVFFNVAGENSAEPLGASKVAAKQALTQTAISRIVLPIPILALPPPILAVCYRLKAVKASRVLKVAAELTVLVAGIWAGLPCAVGIFPQTASLQLKDVEVDIQEKAKEIICARKGPQWLKDHLEEVETMIVTFNKGV